MYTIADNWCDGNVCIQVAAAKVLMVGAGGIGCELVKTLVLTGFRHITLVRKAFRESLKSTQVAVACAMM